MVNLKQMKVILAGIEKVNVNEVLLEKTIKLTRLLALSTSHPPLIYRCTHHRIYVKAACKPFKWVYRPLYFATFNKGRNCIG